MTRRGISVGSDTNRLDGRESAVDAYSTSREGFAVWEEAVYKSSKGARARRFYAIGRAWLLVAVAWISGCSVPTDDELKAEAWPFRIWGDANVVVCDGQLEALQLHYEAVSAFMGIEIPQGEHIDIHVVRDPDEIAYFCRQPVFACAPGSDIIAPALWLPHELIHTYASTIGTPPSLLIEGLAHVLGCGAKGGSDMIERPQDVSELVSLALSTQMNSTRERGIAGDFTRYLIDELGRSTFLDLYGSLHRGRETEQSLEDTFRRQTGLTMSEWAAQWLVTPSRRWGDLCIRPAECTWPAPPEGTATLLSCGPAFTSAGQWDTAFVPIELTDRQRVHVRMDDMFRGVVVVNSCEPSKRPTFPFYTGVQLGESYKARQLQVWELEAGQYSLAISDADSLATVTKERFYRYDIDAVGTSYECLDGAEIDLSDVDLFAYTLPEGPDPGLEQVSLKVYSDWDTPLSVLSNTTGILNAWWCATPCVALEQCIQIASGGDLIPGSTYHVLPAGSSGEFVIERDASHQTTLSLRAIPQQP